MTIRIASYSLAQVRAVPDIRKLDYYPGLERSGNYQRTRDDFKHPIGGVQHIAVAPEDRAGVDSSAEAVTAYGLNPSNKRASWNDCIDRDSYCPLLPPWVRPWQQGVTGMGVDMNEAGIGQEMGIWDTNWAAKPADFVTDQLRMSAAVWAAWFTAYGWPLKATLNRSRLFELARRGESWGLTAHAVIDPDNRSDPGMHRGRDTFPWDRLLGMIREEQAIRTGQRPPSLPEPPAPAPAPAPPSLVDLLTTEQVTRIQEALNLVDDAGIDVDGKYGPATTAAVTNFQRKNGLDPDGVAGPLTTRHLEAGMSRIEDKLDKLVGALTVPLSPDTQKALGAKSTRLASTKVLELVLRWTGVITSQRLPEIDASLAAMKATQEGQGKAIAALAAAQPSQEDVERILRDAATKAIGEYDLVLQRAAAPEGIEGA